MIAQRFRPVGWVAGVAVAATALYMISLQVASERGRLEAIDRKIAMAHRDIRQLQTELGTRASLRQLERWNGEVLSLSAPQVGQYLPGEQALASADRSALGNAPAKPPAVMVAAGSAEEPEVGADAKPVVVATLAADKPKPVAPLVKPAPVAAPAKVAAKKTEAKPERVAMLDNATMRQLARVATSETAGKIKK